MESVRTCVVCRKKAGKQELYRFVRALDGEICFDEKAVLPYRGSWVCTIKSCLTKGFHKRLLFRDQKNLSVDTEEMLNFIKGRIRKSVLERLGLMRKCGQIEMGKDAVGKMLKDQKAYAVICAHDLSERSAHEINNMVIKMKKSVMIKSPFSMDEIGRCIGREKTGVVGLNACRITDEILLQLNKLKEFEL